MHVDGSQFPLVFLRTDDGSDNADTSAVLAEAQFEAVLERGEPFVLIATNFLLGGQGGSAEERKQRALFFKRNKDRLRRFCSGAIIVEGGKPIAAPLKLAAQTIGKAFGFTFHFVASEAEAVDQGDRLVREKTA